MSEAFAKPELPKRFYQDVSLAETEGAFSILLDGRAVKTPARRPLALPHRRAAEEVAGEWRTQGERIDPATMPMTRLANTVIDGVAADPEPVRAEIGRFSETDLLFYRAEDPEKLAMRQREGWDPIVEWMSREVGGPFRLAGGVMHVPQPSETLEGFRARLSEITDPFAVAALHQMTTLTGSALLAYAVFLGRLDAQEAWRLAHIDEDWNIEQWGEDEEAKARRALRWEEMRVAAILATAAA